MKSLSAEARKESIKYTMIALDQLIDLYNLYKKDPSTVRQEEITQMKHNAKRIIQSCKRYNIDYKAKLSKDVLEFYGIE